MSTRASRRRRSFRFIAIGLFSSCGFVAACSSWEPSHPFERNAPAVSEAIEILDAGDAGSASSILEEYLSTGACSEGSIGAPLLVRARPNGGIDLGLSLFRVAEGYGQRFGDEEKKDGLDEMKKSVRGGDIECARKIVKTIAEDDNVPIDLRARARYIEGNLLFLDAKYKDSVKAYDAALTLAPGILGDGGDAIGRDAAWNRAIALRRNEDQKDAGNDASSDASDNDAQNSGDSGDNNPDAKPPNDGGGDGGGKNSGKDGGEGKDSGGDQSPDSGNNDDNKTPDAGPQKSAPPPSMDDSVLDRLENAPTVQQEAAKKQQGQVRRVRGMQDK